MSNDGWAGFLGSYVGGVLGGLGTLIAMYVTMKHSIEIQAENKKDTDQLIIKTKLFGNPDAEKLVHFMEEFHRETGIPQRAAECGLWLDESTEKLMGLFEEFRERYVRGEAAGETPDIWKKPV